MKNNENSEFNQFKSIAKGIYLAWDDALANRDVDGLLKLYAENAILESPLVIHLLPSKIGSVQGKEKIKAFFELLKERKPSVRKHYKQNYFTNGKTIIFEYPRISPNGEQMDFVEVMEIEDGLIQYHKVYWGWYGFSVLLNDEYHQ